MNAPGPHVVHWERGALPQLPDGRLGLPSRTAEGLRSMAEFWDGPVTIAYAATAPVEADNPVVTPIDDTFSFRLAPAATVDALRALDPELVVALAHADTVPLATSGLPYAVYAEVTRRIRWDLYAAADPGLVDRARIRFGQWRSERRMRRLIAAARGALFNGWAARDAYARLAPRHHVYNDHRIRAADLAAASPRTSLRDPNVLTVAFSGRITAIKGVRHLIDAMRLLERRGVRVRCLMLGDGDLRGELEAVAPGNVEFLGNLAFRPTWLERVRADVDLMVLPHVQGDPSMTYFESLGCGVPLLGFENETLTRLLEQWPVGAAVPRGDTAALAARIEALADDPTPLWAWSRTAVAEMRRQPYEDVVEGRLRFLRSLV